jgi:hypothetical protein
MFDNKLFLIKIIKHTCLNNKHYFKENILQRIMLKNLSFDYFIYLYVVVESLKLREKGVRFE